MSHMVGCSVARLLAVLYSQICSVARLLGCRTFHSHRSRVAWLLGRRLFYTVRYARLFGCSVAGCFLLADKFGCSVARLQAVSYSHICSVAGLLG